MTESYIGYDEIKEMYFKTFGNGGETYLFNAGREGSGSYINIYIPNNDDGWDLFLTVKQFEGYWYGYDTTKYKNHGNSILIKIDDHNYMYVGNVLYTFVTKDIILDFVSLTENNDVSEAIAFGTKNTYFPSTFEYITDIKLVENSEKIIDDYYSSTNKKYSIDVTNKYE
jgi:hypothetical protein